MTGALALFLSYALVLAQAPYGLHQRIPNMEFKVRSVGNKLAGKTLENAFPNLRFNESLLLTNAGDGSNRIFVVEKGGRAFVFNNDHDVTSATTFLGLLFDF